MIVARQRPGHKDLFVLHVTGITNIKLLLTALQPYLIIKKVQAQIVLEYCDSRLNAFGKVGRRYSAHELELYSGLIQANRKGGKVTANSRKPD
jgi:hypothetical protein